MVKNYSIGNPGILFADEPTGHLLQEINQDNKQTILMVTHSLEAIKYSNRILTVQDGVLVE